MKKNQTRVYA